MPRTSAPKGSPRGASGRRGDLTATRSASGRRDDALPEFVGPHRIFSELGRGGMGIVYLAEDAKLQRPIALKVLSTRIARDPSGLERFKREARLLAALSHPNIAVIHALEESEAGPFIAMEFVPGENLSDRLARGPLAVEESLRVARQIGAALEAAHEKGVIHRDLKPSNVRIRPDGRLSVLDFGLAKVEAGFSTHDDSVTSASSMVGTPGYMSPEQLRGELADHRADIWAFGCVLYECLTGIRTFAATTPSGKIAATLEREPDWDRLPTDTPERVRHLLRSCLQKSPEDRLDRIALARREIEEELAPGTMTIALARRPRSPRRRPTNLPGLLTSFVGRQTERVELTRLLHESRLVTLTGAGGTGKSRLAMELADEVSENFKHGVCWVELAPLTDPTLVPRTVASALDLRERAGRSVSEVVLDHLRDKTMLLLFDNCEHLLGDCARLAGTILREAHSVHILTTSREPLGIGGEHVYSLSPLAVPQPSDEAITETLRSVESVKLFEDRARAGDLAFRVTPENAGAVGELCRRVDGIPLALELAAARAHVLSPAEIVRHLDERFSILVSGDRNSLPRHRTMAALVEWSYDLLSDSERAMLRRLSIFVGGWALEAAEAVCSGENVPKWEFLDLLARLVGKSLVERDRSQEALGEAARYRFLEPIRQHALSHLKGTGELQELRLRHRRYFLTIAEAAESELRGPRQTTWLNRLEADHANFRAALEPLPDDPEDALICLKLAASLARFWWLRTHCAEGARYFEETTSASAAREHSGIWAKVMAWRGWLLVWQGHLNAAREVAQATVDACRREGLQQELVDGLSVLGSVELNSGNLERAQSAYEEAANLAQRIGDTWRSLRDTGNLAEVVYRRGGYRRAFALARDAYLGRGTAASPFDHAAGLRNIARPAAKLGKRRVARRWLEESLRISRASEDRWGMASSLEQLAGLDVETGRPERAARLLAAADLLRSRSESPIRPAESAEVGKWIDGVRALLGRGAFEAAWSEGRAMPIEELLEEAQQGRPRRREQRSAG